MRWSWYNKRNVSDVRCKAVPRRWGWNRQDWGGSKWGQPKSYLQQDFQGQANMMHKTRWFFERFTLKEITWTKQYFWANLWKIWEYWGRCFLKINFVIPTDEFPFIQDTLWLHNFLNGRSVSVAVATSCRTSHSFVASVGRSGPQAWSGFLGKRSMLSSSKQCGSGEKTCVRFFIFIF